MPDISEQKILHEIKTLEDKFDRLKSTLSEIAHTIEFLRGTLQHFNPEPKRYPRKQQAINVSVEDLAGKNIEEALIYIAEHNNNIINSRVARSLLVEAGILRGTQTSHTLWSHISESNRFEQIRRGCYGLVEEMRS